MSKFEISFRLLIITRVITPFRRNMYAINEWCIPRLIAANAGPNIDLIVGGHSHTLLYPKGETPPSGEDAIDDYPIAVNQTSGTTVSSNILQILHYTTFV